MYKINYELSPVKNLYNFLCQEYKMDVTLAKMNGSLIITEGAVKINEKLILIYPSLFNNKTLNIEFFTRRDSPINGITTINGCINLELFDKLYNGEGK